MANIKTYESPVDKITPTNVGAEAFEMEGRHIESNYAAGGASLGQGLQTVGRQVEEHQTLVETADVLSKMSNLEVQTARGLADAKNNLDPHDPQAASNFIGQYEDDLGKIGDDLGTKGAKEMYTRMSNEYRTRTMTNYIGMQSTAAANDAVSKMSSSVQNFANLANQDPTAASSGVQALTLASNNIPVEHRAQFLREGTASIFDSAAEGVVGRVEGQKVYDPQAVASAKDYINDPKNGFVASMSASKFAEVNNRLDNARRTGDQTTIAGMELNSSVLLDQVKRTGEPPADLTAMESALRATGKPEGIAAADKLHQGMEDAQGYYQANQIITKTSSDKLQAVHDSLQAAFDHAPSGETASIAKAALDHFNEAWAARKAAFTGGDPAKQAAWELENNASVATSYNAFRANPTPQTFYDYYQKSYADQRALEPGQVPSVLTNDMIQDAHGAINEIARNTDPKVGPLVAVQKFGDMAKLYGPAWGQVAGDLRKKGIFNGDQFIMASLSGKPNAQGYVEQLARASVLNDEQRTSMHSVTMHDAQVAVRGEVGDLVNSLGNVNNAGELINDYVNAAAKIMQVSNVQNANSLVQAMFLDQYEFTGANKSIRIPRGQGLNADSIGAGSEHVLDDIGNHDLVVPPGHLGSVNQKENWVDALKHNGVWYTKPDGSGATLYDGSATGNPVMERRNGKTVPVTLNWSDLQSLGKVNQISQQEVTDREAMAQRQAGH